VVIRSNAEVNRYLDRPKHVSTEEAEAFVVKISEGIARQECLYWAICPAGQKELAGTICLWNFSEDRTRAEVGYELMPAWQGQGLMDEALKSVVKFAFERTSFRTLEAFTHPLNRASKRLLERNGFRPDKGSMSGGDSGHLIYRLCREAP
jgi:[ribosomal protein S5]-alanine N-acetyltransferase